MFRSPTANIFLSLSLSLWSPPPPPPPCVGGTSTWYRGEILLENGQYPHNSSYEAPCLPWGATREVDEGILVVESWLMSATEYIASDNKPLRPGVHVDGRSDVARPYQSAGHANLKSNNLCLFNYVKCKHCYIPFVFVALGAVARVNQVIPYILAE